MLQPPSAAFIELAMDLLKSRNQALLILEAKEFNALGRWQEVLELLDPLPLDLVRKVSPDGLAGYLLGLETMRGLIAMLPAAQAAGIEV
jgi:hypothetical protein